MKKILFFFGTGILCLNLSAQTASVTNTPGTAPVFKEGLKLNFNEEGSHYVKLTLLNQTWLRYNENNPGSAVYGKAAPATFDVGLRRTRLQLFSQLSDRVFIYTQFGMNNFNYLSARKTGAFFHDATCEYTLAKKYLTMGAGLTGWSGLSRFSSPSVGSILALDAPLFEQATNDATDQFLRKLSLYAKGKIARLDYRIAVSNPMVIQQSTLLDNSVTVNSTFALTPPQKQFQGYFMWQFLDEESNLMAYNTGTYLGKKRVFNLGAGIITQEQAMWHLSVAGDTAKTPLRLLAADVFYDAPLNAEKQTAVSFYAVYANYNFGPGYIRNLGPMNPVSGLMPGQGSFNGSGSAFPMMGTGSIVYAQQNNNRTI